MRIRCHFDATMLNNKHFAVKEVLYHNLCKAGVKQKMATSDEDAVHRSAIQLCFPSGLMPIDTFCQLKSTECYNNVWRGHVYTWLGRFSDRNTVNTSLGWPKYKNCSIVKIAPYAIDCDYRRTVRLVAGMAGISKYTAQHTLTSDLSMSQVNARWIRLNVWNFY